MNDKKSMWAFLIIAILAVVVLAVFLAKKNLQNQQVSSPPKKVIKIETKEFNPDVLPDKFPSDIPLEAGATVLTNNDVTSDIGHFSAVRGFESKKTVDENFKLYKDFFEKNGWVIGGTVDLENYKIIRDAKKGTMSVTVGINKSTSTGIVIVEITATPEGGAK